MCKYWLLIVYKFRVLNFVHMNTHAHIMYKSWQNFLNFNQIHILFFRVVALTLIFTQIRPYFFVHWFFFTSLSLLLSCAWLRVPNSIQNGRTHTYTRPKAVCVRAWAGRSEKQRVMNTIDASNGGSYFSLFWIGFLASFFSILPFLKLCYRSISFYITFYANWHKRTKYVHT